MALSRMTDSIIGDSDSYKVTHNKQLPPGTTSIYSYQEARIGSEFPYTVFFGLYYQLVEYLEKPITQEDVDFFESFFTEHFFGDDTLYNKGDWQLILDEHDGFLPVEIRAVPEGTVVPTGNVLLTIENLDDRLPWLTNYLETFLSRTWYSSTVATLSRRAKEIIANYMVLTGADLGGLPFKLHDLGSRGVSCREQAAIGGAAHLINFQGTDTLQGILFAQAYYGAKDMPGFSIPAAEHSTITSWGDQTQEYKAFRNMIEQFGSGAAPFFAVVSDSFNIMDAVTDTWGKLLIEEVRDAPNMLVVRPDSGDVIPVVLEVLDRLGAAFGYTVNDLYFKVLDGVRVIQGDGMSLEMIEDLCEALYREGWSIENLAMGMGGGLLQNVNRDTGSFAIKCSAVIVDGEERPVFKKPVTDAGKDSMAGRFSLVRNPISGELETKNWYETEEADDLLEVVYRNGKYVGRPPRFSEIRERAEIDILTGVLA